MKVKLINYIRWTSKDFIVYQKWLVQSQRGNQCQNSTILKICHHFGAAAIRIILEFFVFPNFLIIGLSDANWWGGTVNTFCANERYNRRLSRSKRRKTPSLFEFDYLLIDNFEVGRNCAQSQRGPAIHRYWPVEEYIDCSANHSPTSHGKHVSTV